MVSHSGVLSWEIPWMEEPGYAVVPQVHQTPACCQVLARADPVSLSLELTTRGSVPAAPFNSFKYSAVASLH